MINIKINGIVNGETIEHDINTNEFIIVMRDGSQRGNYKTIGILEDALTMTFALLDETSRAKNEFLKRSRESIEAKKNVKEQKPPEVSPKTGFSGGDGYISLANREEILKRLAENEE